MIFPQISIFCSYIKEKALLSDQKIMLFEFLMN